MARENEHIGDPRYTVVDTNKLMGNNETYRRMYQSKVINNNEKLFDKDLSAFLKSAQEKYEGFKIEGFDMKDLGIYKNSDHKIYGVIIFSFLVKEGK